MSVIDKSRELHANLGLVNDKLHFRGTNGTHEPVSIDYFPPAGDGLAIGVTLMLIHLVTIPVTGTSVNVPAALVRRFGFEKEAKA